MERPTRQALFSNSLVSVKPILKIWASCKLLPASSHTLGGWPSLGVGLASPGVATGAEALSCAAVPVLTEFKTDLGLTTMVRADFIKKQKATETTFVLAYAPAAA